MKIKKMFSLVTAFIMAVSSLSVNVSAEEKNKDKKAKSPVEITVGKGNGYDYQSINEALASIDVIPTQYNRATINIAKGIYEEDIVVSLPYVSFVNSGKGDVIISYDKANGHSDSSKNQGTQKTATVTVDKSAVGFKAENITFKNSYNIDYADREQTQAVALASLADKVVFEKCKFIGRQDTLYLNGASKGQDVYGEAEKARVYLKDCYIEGTVDFIFGDATAYFDKCRLNMAYSEKGGHYTAPNTTLFNIGYVFDNCTLTTDSSYTEAMKEKIDLGRPWQCEEKYPSYGSQAVYINCNMPKILKNEGFKLWSEETVSNKVRFYEYNSKNTSTKNRADFVKQLTDEQARAYCMENIFDGWNPFGGKYIYKPTAADVTLDRYNIKIPTGGEDKLKAFVLPENAANKSVTYKSSDESIAKVDKNGNIKAVKPGKAEITVTTNENKFTAKANIEITAPKTSVPVISEIKIKHKEEILPGDTLSVDYKYELDSDMKTDKALIRWFAVSSSDNKKAFLLKEGRGEDAKKYDVAAADGGYYIKAVVYPETETTYGNSGMGAEAVSAVAVKKKEDGSGVLLRESFSDTSKWEMTNSSGKTEPFKLLQDRGNSLITNECDENSDYSLIEYKAGEKEEKWGNGEYEMRLRFNPQLKGGWNGESYLDFYTLYNGKTGSYYKLRAVRGGNTNSLKLYLYRKDGTGEEVLVKSDEKSLSNNVPQNDGEKNPWFRIKEKIENNMITISFVNDSDLKTMASFFIKEENRLENGFAAVECYGKNEAVLIDTISVLQTYRASNGKVRIYLAGDSTVKSWGNDNSIGGWGEYLQYYFNDNVEIINKAEGGRSTRSYLNQGRLDEILNEIREGDFLFIQFGHNDARTDDAAFTEHSVKLGAPDANGIYPITEGKAADTPDALYEAHKNNDYVYGGKYYPYESGNFKWYLKLYVDRAREKGAIPVLITPVSRVFFDENGKIKSHHGENDGYVESVRQLAAETNTVLVDMYKITKELYESYGERVTQSMQNIKDDGSMDVTHYNKFGSNIISSKLVQELARQGIYIAKDAVVSRKAVSKTDDMRRVSLYIAGGNSAAQYYDNDEYALQKKGWGNYIGNYFVDKLTVKNYAKEGMSVKTFTQSDEYEKMMAGITNGDYIMINFGEADDLLKDTDLKGDKETKGSFKYYLYEYYIKPALEVGAVPILITPARERVFGDDGRTKESYADYTSAISELAAELGTGYVNLNNVTAEIYDSIGRENSKIFSPIYKTKLKGDNGFDNKNLNSYGADMLAGKIAGQLKFSSATLKNYENDSAIDEKEKGDYITKADFASQLMAVSGYDYKIYINFGDVEKGKDYYNGVGIAKSIGAARGDAEGKFYPEREITKTEAQEMINTALKGKSFDISKFTSNEEDNRLTREAAGRILCGIYEIKQEAL